MPRAGQITYREIAPDPRYHSQIVAKLINRTMLDGKKSVAQTQIYQAFDLLATTTKQEPMEVFDLALKNIIPQMEVRSRRVGGAAYQVPTPVRPHRASSLGIRWLVTEARKRPNKSFHSFAEKLAAEILDATKGEGGAVARKQTAHRQAEANRAFAHFRW